MSTTFDYRALDPMGRVQTGSIEAETRTAAIAQLDQAGFIPLSAETRGQTEGARRWRDLLTPEPRPDDITTMTLDLAMLLRGGVTLTDALQILIRLENRRWLTTVLQDLYLSLSQGKSLSQAVARHPRLFPPIYRKMVEVAEAAGRLEETLGSLAAERQRVERLRRRFMSAITYPIFLIFASLAVMAFVLIYLIPKFETALQGFRDRIDPAALFVFNLSAFVNTHLDALVLGFAAFLGACAVAARLGRERGLWLGLTGRLPIVNTLLAHELTVTFCRTLAVLIGGGVDISTALRLIRGVVRGPGTSAEIDHVIADLRQGRRLSEALGERRFLPHHVVQMLRVGEEAGKLPDSARQVAAFYETKLEASLGRLVAIVGPAVMVVVSLLIAWLIISVMTALMSINDLLV